MGPSGSLTEVNARAHAALDEQALSFLEAVTAMELPEARRRFEAFRASLAAHLSFEDERVLPAIARVHAEHGAPGDLLPKHLDGDHRILERTLRKADAALERLASGGGGRREMVRELDGLLLLRRVLEHHDERETRLGYPLLDHHLDEDTAASLRAGLEGATPADPPGSDA